MTARAVSLRRRVTWASALLGLVMGLLSAGAVVLVAEDYEHVLASEILRGQAEDYGLRIANGLPAQLPRTQRLSGYRGTAPAEYAAYAPGIQEDPEREGVHVGVFDTAAGRLVFVIDLGDIELLEQHLNAWLVLITLVGVAVSGWLGWLLAGRALAPVGTLAAAVDALPETPAPSHLAATVSSDELGRLAGAIDAYQARLAEADARQRRFFADASHELRTPIAVVQGAAEVLLDDPGLPAASTARLARLERGVHELTDLLDAMFAVARQSALQVEPVELAELAREALRPWTSASPPLAMTITGEGSAELPRRESVLLIRLLARRYLAGASPVHVQIGDGWMRFGADGGDAPGAGEPERADAGALSVLVRRTAARAGWSVDVSGRGFRLVRVEAGGDGDGDADASRQHGASGPDASVSRR